MVLNRNDIEKCKDINKLRDLTLVQFDFISKVHMALESMVNDGLDHKECISDIMGYVYDYNIALTDIGELNPRIMDREIKFEIKEDKLIRSIPLFGYGEGVYQEDIVMDKETFIKCFREWMSFESEPSREGMTVLPMGNKVTEIKEVNI